MSVFGGYLAIWRLQQQYWPPVTAWAVDHIGDTFDSCMLIDSHKKELYWVKYRFLPLLAVVVAVMLPLLYEPSTHKITTRARPRAVIKMVRLSKDMFNITN